MSEKDSLINLIPLILSFLLLGSSNVESANIYVPEDYATIQQAVSAAITGDHIVVRPDTHIVTGVLSIPENLTLDLEPGVILKFHNKYSRLNVDGTLRALGGETTSEKIVFTSYLDDEYGGDTNGDGAATSPSYGSWDQVYFGHTSTESELTNVIVRYGGGGYGTPCDWDMAAVRVENCSIILRQSIIEQNQHTGLSLIHSSSTIYGVTFVDNSPCTSIYEYGGFGLDILGGDPIVQNCFFSQNKRALYVRQAQTPDNVIVPAAPLIENNVFEQNGTPIFVKDSVPYFSNNQALNNEINGVVFWGSGHGIPMNTSWQADLPYVVRGRLTVSMNVTLNINPEVVVKFYDKGSGFTVNGTLKAENVVFTSFKDDEYGGDTNNDSSATSPSPGDWDKIYFSPTSVDSELKDVIVRYGGGGFGTPCSPSMSGITVDQSSIILSNSIIEYNQYKGLALIDSSSIIQAVNFIDNPPCEASFTYGGSAIWIDGGSPIVKNCIFTGHRYGAQVQGLTGGGIYLNNFQENDLNAMSVDSAGYWNSPEKLTYNYSGDSFLNYLGNYWDDYSGIDPLLGDGIGWPPYSIGTDFDNYPLMMPFENYGFGGIPSEQRLVVFQNDNEVQNDFLFNKANLQYGTSHQEVEILQFVLKHEGFFPFGIHCNGNYYQITKAAVTSFQQDRGLGEQDGIVGDETLAELNKILDTKCTLDASRASLICEYVSQFCHTFLPDYFPPELVLAVAAQESGGVFFDNAYVSGDCGRGIMQITSKVYFGNGSGVDCTDTDSVECGVGDCEFHYKNTVCGIEANIKDGLYALHDKYRSYCPQDSILVQGIEFTCEDLEMISAVWKYNGRICYPSESSRVYLSHVGDKLDSLDEYFPGVTYANNDGLIQKFQLAGDNRKIVKLCSPAVLSVIDPIGRITGEVGDQPKEEIPWSVYDPDSEAVMVLFSNEPLRYRVIGTGGGLYGLSAELTENGASTLFHANDILTSLDTIHEYVMDWDVLSAGGEGVTIYIDTNGDGNFERTVVADNDLTDEEFALQTETIIDFDPDVLNLRSPGKLVTVYIELPEGFDVSNIDVSTLKLNDTVFALSAPIGIGDYDEDGIADLMVKFDRQQVIELLGSGTQMITLTGRLSGGRPIAGIDFIRVIDGTTTEAVELEFEPIVADEFITDMEENLQSTTDDSAGNAGEEAFDVREAIGFMLFEVGETIVELGPASFNNEESAFQLECYIDEVFTMLDEGMYVESLIYLENDILQRMDGCANTGQPDENDWITSIEGQALLYPRVVETIESLESML